jgi:hypothetical protein
MKSLPQVKEELTHVDRKLNKLDGDLKNLLHRKQIESKVGKKSEVSEIDRKHHDAMAEKRQLLKEKVKLEKEIEKLEKK